jgi:hypothetical protein
VIRAARSVTGCASGDADRVNRAASWDHALQTDRWIDAQRPLRPPTTSGCEQYRLRVIDTGPLGRLLLRSIPRQVVYEDLIVVPLLRWRGSFRRWVPAPHLPCCLAACSERRPGLGRGTAAGHAEAPTSDHPQPQRIHRSTVLQA